jgi:MFS family permease
MRYFSERPSPFIRAFIVSDALLYASLNVVNILFAVYVTSKISGGTVQAATGALAAGFVVRIVTELAAGRRITRLDERMKVWIVMVGMVLISLSYFGFIWADTVFMLSLLWAINGLGWGLALPTKMSLVSKHINHNQSNEEWGLTDALNMSLITVTMAIGSFIVAHYNYALMFGVAGALNTLGLLPYLVYLRQIRRD